MRQLIKLVHIGKSQLNIDDDSYRFLLFQAFEKRSSKELNEQELRELINILQQKGATIRLPFGRNELSPTAKKIWAIWKAMANKGIVIESSSNALNNYVKRMFPKKQWNKLTANEASQVIESLKQWQKRVGG